VNAIGCTTKVNNQNKAKQKAWKRHFVLISRTNVPLSNYLDGHGRNVLLQ